MSRMFRPSGLLSHDSGGEAASSHRACFPDISAKILAHHRERIAVVYVRQSSAQQVLEHRESAALQYSLAHRAVQLGWSQEQVLVIDEDQGQSGRTAEGRLGFQHLLAEVGLNHIGLVLGIEMSRLARSCKDWYQLLELCAVFDTLLADQDGLYDPKNYNDRLLLGLKGTMSEAELHILRQRMDQGRQNKARRGELFSHVPMGYVRLPSGEVAVDPDQQARGVVRLIFEKFEELGSAMAVLRYLVEHEIHLPVRSHKGPNRGQLEWRRPRSTTLLGMLHHPIYAGVYSYGRHWIDPRRKVPGKRYSGRVRPAMDEWQVRLEGRLPAYISWEQYLANQQQLTQNRSRIEALGAPREGVTLLSGLVYCGRCGWRMTVAYRGGAHRARYCCHAPYMTGMESPCPGVLAQVLDELIRRQVWQVLEPAALELSLEAAESIERERRRLREHWQERLERAQYQAERARRQYDAVEPENRLVARELERRWEEALAEWNRLQNEYDRLGREQFAELSPDDRTAIKALASDVPALWYDTSTTAADRQTIVRHLVERVVVTIQGETEIVDVTIHWQGGFVNHHQMLRSVARYEQLRDYDRLRDRVLELHAAGSAIPQIAKQLNVEGFPTPKRGKRYSAALVQKFLCRLGISALGVAIRSTWDQRGANEWWVSDLARALGISVKTLYHWRRRGWVHGRKLPGGWCVIWADSDELDRLRRLRSCRRGPPEAVYPRELTTPKPRRAS